MSDRLLHVNNQLNSTDIPWDPPLLDDYFPLDLRRASGVSGTTYPPSWPRRTGADLLFTQCIRRCVVLLLACCSLVVCMICYVCLVVMFSCLIVSCFGRTGADLAGKTAATVLSLLTSTTLSTA